jgi:hypothetical protein
LRELIFDEGLDLGFIFNVQSEQKNYNVGDISINFKREKFKFFSEIKIPNSLKITAKSLPFDISIDYPNKIVLYQKFKIKIFITSFLKKPTEFTISLSER